MAFPYFNTENVHCIVLELAFFPSEYLDNCPWRIELKRTVFIYFLIFPATSNLTRFTTVMTWRSSRNATLHHGFKLCGYFDGLMQKRRSYIANALESRLCFEPVNWGCWACQRVHKPSVLSYHVIIFSLIMWGCQTRLFFLLIHDWNFEWRYTKYIQMITIKLLI